MRKTILLFMVVLAAVGLAGMAQLANAQSCTPTYDTFCFGCHGSAANFGPRTVTQINNAYANVTAMANQSVKPSAAQIQAISTELSSAQTVAPVINTFTATPASITPGQTSTLAWTLGGGAATTLSIDNGVGSVLGQTSVIVTPTVTTTYTLTASNCAGSVTAQTTVTVTQNPAAPVITSFTANPGMILPGNSSTLSWTLAGGAVTALTIDNGVGSVLGQTSVIVTPTVTTTYTLTATNGVGTVTATATVTVSNGAPVPLSGTFGIPLKVTSIKTKPNGSEKFVIEVQIFTGTIAMSIGPTGLVPDVNGCFINMTGTITETTQNPTTICIDSIASLIRETTKSTTDTLKILGSGTVTTTIGTTQFTGPVSVNIAAKEKDDTSDNVISLRLNGTMEGGVDANFIFSGKFSIILIP